MRRTVFDMFETAGFMPHGYCLLWQPSLVALHAVSDLLIALSYFAIPLVILRLLKARPDLQFGRIAILFAAFILLCGLSHVVGLVTLWLPIYELQGIVKALTAVVSVAAVAVLIPLVPVIARMPSPMELEAANRKLSVEIERHKATTAELEQVGRRLESTIEDRTRLLRETKEQEREVRDDALHRARSALAIVQSLTRQSAAFATGKEEFAEALTGRVGALGSVLATIGPIGSDEVALKDILASQFSHRGNRIEGAQVTLDGPPVIVSGPAAQNIGLAIHELIDGAVRHGNAAHPDGWVRIRWSITDGDDEVEGPALRIEWEDGGSDQSGAWSLGGFGHALLLRLVPIQMRGSARAEDTGTGLRYILTVPLDEATPRPQGPEGWGRHGRRSARMGVA